MAESKPERIHVVCEECTFTSEVFPNSTGPYIARTRKADSRGPSCSKHPHICQLSVPIAACALSCVQRSEARKRRSRRCTKLPASACLDVPEFENCIHEGACIRPCASRALLAGGAVSQRVCWKD